MIREKRWRDSDREETGSRSPIPTLVALVLACATMVTLDLHHDSASPLNPVRGAVGSLLGPVERGTTSAIRPFSSASDWFRSRQSLRNDVARLESENSELRTQVATSGVDRNRLAEFDRLSRAAHDSGQALVPARVIGIGPAQSFSNTVTIDAGSAAGVAADMTVRSADGLVGRVLRVTRSTATVLLVPDAESTVGARVGSSMEIGFLTGRGVLGGRGLLSLELVDGAEVPRRGDIVVTWGSAGGAPYVADVPIGRVTRVYASLRDSSHRADVAPLVDYTSLDLVGVVVPTGTPSDRSLIEADGSLR